MEEFKNMKQCFVCGLSYQYGAHNYGGKHIRLYEVDVCLICWKANHDGWSPAFEGRILQHLKDKGISQPQRNKKGWLPLGS
jgi:hypothetical protein